MVGIIRGFMVNKLMNVCVVEDLVLTRRLKKINPIQPPSVGGRRVLETSDISHNPSPGMLIELRIELYRAVRDPSEWTRFNFHRGC